MLFNERKKEKKKLVHVWGHACVAFVVHILNIIYFIHVRMSVCNFVHSRDLGAQLWAIFDDEL